MRAWRSTKQDLPGRLQITETNVAEFEPFIAPCGSCEDNRPMGEFRDDTAKGRKRFDIG